MAIKVEKNDEQILANGWTRYQQLVLNELERHEAKLDILEKEIVNLKLLNQRLELELQGNTGKLSSIMAKLDSLEKKLDDKTDELDKQREEMNVEVKGLKWKIGTAAAVVASVFTATVQAVIKYLFLH